MSRLITTGLGQDNSGAARTDVGNAIATKIFEDDVIRRYPWIPAAFNQETK